MHPSRPGIAPGEYYHIYNRGAHQQRIFLENHDWQRFLFDILYLQSPEPFNNVSRITRNFSATIGFPVDADQTVRILERRYVELVAFCGMPNHYHLLVREREEGGIARYLQRVADGYTKYFNTVHERSGYVFQGPYKAVHVANNEQLLYLSAYIHRNPREIKGWTGREAEYPWSSLQDYVTANRWGGLLATDIIASQFGATKNSNYADFVRSSTAKTLKEELKNLFLS